VNSKEFELEKQNLKHTIEQIKNKEYYVHELVQNKKSEFKHQTNDPGDLISYRSGEHEKKLLSNALNEPYFGRFDIYSDEEGLETFYIGKQGVIDQDEEIVVVDWRKPIAS
jgi:DNA helicase II / ATP-dependent DNA helicase PcrA